MLREKRIFVSYRRADTASVAGRLCDRLKWYFGWDNVFFDVEDIEKGADFRESIFDAVARCDIFLAIIGKQWLTDCNDGSPKLANEDDVVRREIRAAFEYARPIIPILVSGARMPLAAELPTEISNLSYLNAAHLEPGPNFNDQFVRIIHSIHTAVGEPAPPGFNRFEDFAKAAAAAFKESGEQNRAKWDELGQLFDKISEELENIAAKFEASQPAPQEFVKVQMYARALLYTTSFALPNTPETEQAIALHDLLKETITGAAEIEEASFAIRTVPGPIYSYKSGRFVNSVCNPVAVPSTDQIRAAAAAFRASADIIKIRS